MNISVIIKLVKNTCISLLHLFLTCYACYTNITLQLCMLSTGRSITANKPILPRNKLIATCTCQIATFGRALI